MCRRCARWGDGETGEPDLRPREGAGGGDVRIAIVICTKDRPEALRETLASVWSQSRKPDELLILDDGRMDDVARGDLARDAAHHHIGFIYHRKHEPGLTRSRNVAAQRATADVLIYLDDDVTCAANFVQEIAAIMADPRVAAVSPVLEEPRLQGRAARIWQLGYRIAGWWRVRPDVNSAARGAPPAMLAWEPHRVRPLAHLSGAAMALRRDVVLANPFDESLTQYALGEDREMGYRLAPRHWLLEAIQTNVVHRRETGGRGDPHRFGFMTSRNYLYILTRTCRMSPGRWALIVWSLLVIAIMHAAWGLTRREHWLELRGMIEGVRAFAAERIRHRSSLTREPQPALRGDELRRTSGVLLNGPASIGARDRTGAIDRPLRVLFVTNRLEPGGAELMLASLAKHLPARGVQPVIACLKDAGPLAADLRARGILVHEQLLHHKTDVAVIPRLRRLLRDEAIDLVTVAHSGGDRMFWSTVAAATRRTPVVVWSHWFPRAGHQHFETANRALYRFVDVFVALGERQRHAMIRHEKVPAGRIAVIRNAIELDAFIGRSRSAARRALRLADDQFSVGIVANLRAEKRHDAFIRAARTLAGRFPNMRFFIIGDGPNRDAVLAAAEASGLDHERLRLLGARHDVPDLLPGLDVACLCSEIECFSVSMLEAAVCGVPFVAPNVGCLGEFLVHEQTGLLTRPADPEGLALAVERLATDADQRHRIVETARRRVVHEFGVEHMAGAFSDLFAVVAARGPRKRSSTRRAIRAAPSAV